MWAVLGADQGLNWRSLEGIRAYLTVLGADQGLPGRSWERIRPYVGGPGGSKAEKWPKPEREPVPIFSIDNNPMNELNKNKRK